MELNLRRPKLRYWYYNVNVILMALWSLHLFFSKFVLTTEVCIYLIFTFIKVIEHSPVAFKLQLRTCCGICIVATHCSTCTETIERKHEMKVANSKTSAMIFLETKRIYYGDRRLKTSFILIFRTSRKK